MTPKRPVTPTHLFVTPLKSNFPGLARHKRFALVAFGLHFGHSLWRLSPCSRGWLQTPPHLRHVLLPLAQEPREAQFKQRWRLACKASPSQFATAASGKKTSQVRQVNQPARPCLSFVFASFAHEPQAAAQGMVAIALLNLEIGFSLRQVEQLKLSTSFKQRRLASESSCCN